MQIRRWSVIPGLALIFYQHTKFGNSCISRCRDMIACIKLENGSFDNDHTSEGVVCHPKATVFSRSINIIGAPKIKVDHETLTMPL